GAVSERLVIVLAAAVAVVVVVIVVIQTVPCIMRYAEGPDAGRSVVIHKLGVLHFSEATNMSLKSPPKGIGGGRLPLAWPRVLESNRRGNVKPLARGWFRARVGVDGNGPKSDLYHLLVQVVQVDSGKIRLAVKSDVSATVTTDLETFEVLQFVSRH